MKKAIRILLPIFLGLSILVCSIWYLFSYDREFTRDMLLHGARFFENQGNHEASAKLYNLAYKQANDNDRVAIELSQQYRSSGNYTKAEYVLNQAIAEGGSEDLYIALSKLYVEQDKILDAAKLLDAVCRADSTIDQSVKDALIAKRPAAPTSTPEPGLYSQYITVTLESEGNTIYANAQGLEPSVQSDLYTKPIETVLGENIIFAVAVSEEGLVSPRVSFKFTIGGVIEAVDFADPEIEKSVHTLLNKPENKPVMTNELWEITEFTIPSNTKVYSDLKHMKNLEKLTVSSGVSGQLSNISSLTLINELVITDTTVSSEELTVIGSLPLLNKLTLSNCKLSTLSGLSKATALTYLDLSENTIRSVSELSSMTDLKELNLSQNAVNDISALNTCTSLIVLDLSGNAMTSLSSACSIKNLSVLKADKNLITELGDLSQLTSLAELTLSYNQLTDISVLGQCLSIKTLDVSNNSLVDISMLAQITGLEHLNFAYNQVAQLPAFDAGCALISIDGTMNLLSDLTPLSGLGKLCFVHMDHNKEITSIAELASCNMLATVSVFGTSVEEVRVLTDMEIVVHHGIIKEEE